MRFRLALVLLSLLYLGARYQNFPGVVSDAGIQLPDTDPYYRLVRIERMAKGKLTYPLHDPSLSPPRGLDVPWPLGLDLLLAAPLKIFGVTSRFTIAAASAVAIPLLSLPAIIAIAETGRILAGPLLGLAAAFLLALSPAAVSAASVGRVDHHFLETECTILALFLLTLVRIRESRRAWWGLVGLLGLAPSFWPQAWVLSLFVAVSMIFDASSAIKSRGFSLFSSSGLLSLFPLALSERFWSGTLSIFGFSWWTPMVCFGLAALFLLSDWERRKWKNFRRHEVAFMALTAVLLAYMSIRHGGDVTGEILTALKKRPGTFLTTTETLLTPLIPLHRWLPLGLWLLPVAWIWFSMQAFRKEHWWLVGFWLAPLTLALLQARFVPLASPLMILGSLFLLNDALNRFVSKRALVAPVFVAACVAISIPSNPTIGWTHAGNPYSFFPAVAETSRFLSGRSPGVVAGHWDFGHWLLYYTGYPVVAHPFQGESAMDVVRLFVGERPEGLDKFVKKYEPRYLMIEKPSERLEEWMLLAGRQPGDYMTFERNGQGGFGAKPKESFHRLFSPRMYLTNGQDLSGKYLPNWRIVQAASRDFNDQPGPPALKVFEHVKGAVIQMRRVAPGSQLEVDVKVRSEEFTYIAGPVALGVNPVEFRIPYSEWNDGNVSCDGKVYLRKAGSGARELIAHLVERDVVEGRVFRPKT